MVEMSVKTRVKTSKDKSNAFLEARKENRDPDNLEETNDTRASRRSRKSRKATKRERETFASSIDPYDVPLNWWETDCIKYSISHPPVKTRLLELMGSEVVRLTDRRYMVLLMSRIMEDRVERQRRRIEARKVPPESVVRKLLAITYDILAERVRQRRRCTPDD